MKLAAQMYTVRDFTQTNDDVRRTLARIREIGYEAVQISGLVAYDPENIRKGLEENGLTAPVTHIAFDRIVNDTEKVIDEHRLMGARYIGLGYYVCDTLDGYRELLSKLAPATEKIKKAGMRFLYHNHNHEFRKFGGETVIEYMRKHTESGKFDFLPDMYWVQKAGGSPEKFLREFEGRTPVVHFKDMKFAAEGKTDMAEIFEGNMDYEGIYALAKKQGVEWAVVEQDYCDGDPFDSLAISLRNLRAHGMF